MIKICLVLFCLNLLGINILVSLAYYIRLESNAKLNSKLTIELEAEIQITVGRLLNGSRNRYKL